MIVEKKKLKAPRKGYWNRVIDTAEQRGAFNCSEKREAGHWVTCACGEQDVRIPRKQDLQYQDDEPEDDVLVRLGLAFSRAVDNDQFNDARAILSKIEERAIAVLTELGYLPETPGVHWLLLPPPLDSEPNISV